MKRVLLVALMLLLPTMVNAQITGITTFTPNTRILSAEVNANFTKLKDEALNRTGGTMTGQLTSADIVPSSTNAMDLGSATFLYRSLYLRTSIVLGQTGGNYTITWANPAAGRSLSIPDPGGNDSFVFAGSTQTLTGKTLASPTFTGTITIPTTATFVPSSGNGYIFDNNGTGVGPFFHIDSGHTAGTDFGAGILFDLNSTTVASVKSYEHTADTWSLVFGTTNAGAFGEHLILTGQGYLKTSASNTLTAAPTQPGFLAYNSATDAGIGSPFTVDVDTEVYDNSSSFAADTFTAPIAGQYLFCGTASPNNTGGAPSNISLHLVTSNRTYDLVSKSVVNGTTDVFGGCVVADMDASDTASLQLITLGTFSVVGSGSPNTHFSGRLLP